MFPRPAYTRLRDLNERVPALSFRARRLPSLLCRVLRLPLPEADRSQQSARRPMAASQRSLPSEAKFFQQLDYGPAWACALLLKRDWDMRQGAKKLGAQSIVPRAGAR